MRAPLKVLAAAAAAVALLAMPAVARVQTQTELSHAPVATNSTFNSAYVSALSADRDPANRLGPAGVEFRD
jgi:hypothetical protein